MKKTAFILAYDISSPKTLPKIARLLEGECFRIQKSIFYHPELSKEQINLLIKQINAIIDKRLDDVRIYKINLKKSYFLNKISKFGEINVFLS